MSFRANLKRKRKEKSVLFFRSQDKSVQLAFRVNLNSKCKDKSFLSFLHQEK